VRAHAVLKTAQLSLVAPENSVNLAVIRLTSIIVPSTRLCFKQDSAHVPTPVLVAALEVAGVGG